MNNAEDPFLWRDARGGFHAIHHWQDGDHNQYYNGGHSFSADGVQWTFSAAAAYTTNVTWRGGGSTVFARRERPGLLLDKHWQVPQVLFTSVADGKGGSWMQSQPIRQAPAARGVAGVGGTGGARCADGTGCNLNGLCHAGRCVCDAQWQGADCGTLALLPAARDGGFRRTGFHQWGGNPFYSEFDSTYHVFAVEMTKGCSIGDYITNSQIVHAESATAEGPYVLAPIARGGAHSQQVPLAPAPAPADAVLVAPFAHAAHTWRDPSNGALIVVYEGRGPRVPDAKQRQCA